MIHVNRVLIVVVISFLLAQVVYAQSVETKNLGFENGNFSGWKGYAWRESVDVTSINTSPAEVTLPTSRRHVLISDQSAYDANTGNALKMIPEGYIYSARLGDEIKSSDSRPRCWEQSLRYTMTVDSSNAFLLMKFACVMEYASDHTEEMEPRFKLTLYDQFENKISDCANYDVFSSSSIEGFKSYTPSGANDPVMWRDWTTVGANLTKYLGQEITIEFMAADCKGQFHFGYAYFVLDCMPLYITVDYCTGDSMAVLEAPEGFATYEWLDTDSLTIIGTEQDLILTAPKEGEKYYCHMESETGCEMVLSADIIQYDPKADFSWEMIDCFSNEVKFTNNSTTNTGSLNYLWSLENDTTLSDKSFTYKFNSSGLHDVGLIIYNPPSGCTDTLLKSVESFSPPLVGFDGDTTYCPEEETELEAYGAYSYEWSTGELTDNISIGSPGGNYWMLGYSSPEEGCVSDTIRFYVSEEPDWPFGLIADSILCIGNIDTIYASGAVNYNWNTGDTTEYIVVTDGGSYIVSGANARGCIKELAIDVEAVQKPDLDFSVSPTTINRRYNSVTCSAESNDAILFEWDLGDGTSSSSQQLIHYYSVSSGLVSYPIIITVTNDANCFTSKSTVINVEPFVPNVFTPNNDGINDLFMAGYNLKIFDRHGIILFDGDTGWDGYYNGKSVDSDTYFYQLIYVDVYDQEHVKKGFIVLER